MTIKRFEELIAWQKARVLTAAIYRATDTAAFARDRALRDQMRRAAVSIMSNVAEGQERGARAEFCHFLSIAKASCAEVRSQLYIALDVGHVDQTAFSSLHGQAEEVGRVIGGLRASVAKVTRNE